MRPPRIEARVLAASRIRALREPVADKLALVAVMSGRAASDVAELVGVDGLAYVGNHGAELLTERVGWNSRRRPNRAGVRWTARSPELRDAVDLPGMVWQDKGLSASVHYRLTADPQQRRARPGRQPCAARGRMSHDVEAFWGKMALELRAANGPNKGSATRDLARRFDLDGLLFVGDDTTDVDAMRAVREMSSGGALAGLSVVVLHHDTPEPALRAAHYSLDGVPEVGRFLSWLEGAVREVPSPSQREG